MKILNIVERVRQVVGWLAVWIMAFVLGVSALVDKEIVIDAPNKIHAYPLLIGALYLFGLPIFLWAKNRKKNR